MARQLIIKFKVSNKEVLFYAEIQGAVELKQDRHWLLAST